MTLRRRPTGENDGQTGAAKDSVGSQRTLRGLRIDRLRARHLLAILIVGVGTLASIGGVDGQEPFQPTFEPNSPGFSVAGAGRTPPTVPASGSAQAQASPRSEAPSQSPTLPANAMGDPDASEPSDSLGDQADSEPLSCLQTSAGGDVWQLIFADDFEADEVNQSDWYLYDSPGNAGFGLRRPSAISVQDGVLVLTAQMIDGVLVSGGMAHRSDQIYGRWEFRVRTDPDPSEATSGVVLTWPESDRWPIDGENDMYETERRADRTPFRTYIHYGADNSQEYLTHDADGTEWHDMAMEWTADRITMFRDGAFAGEITRDEVIPDVPHHMTVQLDAWTEEMGPPVRMYVDWVRVYRLDDLAESC